VKVRLQTRPPKAPKTTLATLAYVLQNEGLSSLYTGISAALLRQMTYSTVRFGVYEDLKSRFSVQNPTSNTSQNLSMTTLIALSSFAGLLGGIAGNPADVLNVRMQSDASKPPDVRQNYKNALSGLVRMIREEGLSSVWRGVGPNTARAVLANASQLASYDYFKSICLSLNMSDSLGTHLCTSVAAGFVTTTVCSPVDVIKSRIMSGVGLRVPVLKMIQAASQKEGLLWMFRGWVPSFMRLGPQTVFTMAFFEQHKKWYRQWKGNLE
jgi:solute carrier family 25 (mitochondrial dicarboxylate transporter), member 10